MPHRPAEFPWLQVRRHQRGFSLIEVLVAFVIMALTLSVLFQVFGTGLRTTSTADAYVQAGMLAQARLALAADQPPLQASYEQGRFEGTPFGWEQIIVPVDEGGFGVSAIDGFETYQVAVRVFWPAGRGERELTLSTLRLQRLVP